MFASSSRIRALAASPARNAERACSISSSRAGRDSTPKNLLSPDEGSAGRPDRVKRCMGTRHMAVTASDKGVAEPLSYRRTRVRSFVPDFGQECSPRGAGCGPMLGHGVFQTTDHAPLTLKPRRRSTAARGRVRPSERARARRASARRAAAACTAGSSRCDGSMRAGFRAQPLAQAAMSGSAP